MKHLDYIHYNSVQHGYVKNPVDWKWSSFHRYVQLEWYDKNWGSQKPGEMMAACVGE